MMILDDRESDLLFRMFTRGSNVFQDDRDHHLMHELRVKLLQDAVGRDLAERIHANSAPPKKFPFS